ncbi:MAG TPA: Wzz/FepE/Etk N-terminal domain-containing protein [Terriglobales bacterium]|jgi:uncharacterized protein involved in exopolysaccharide biosynthesis|nr:Wzz/FepE/Etk N-terminal domain-containing protein [Terriglobales bacterium]
MGTSRPGIVPTYEPSFPSNGEGLPPQSEAAKTEKLWLLWKQRRFLWGVVWKSALVSVVVAFLIPVRYTSTAKLVPGDTSNPTIMAGMMSRLAGGGAGGGADLGLDAAGLLGIKTPSAYYIAILQSRTVQDRLIDRFDLRKVYWRRYYKDARKKLMSYTDIEEDKKSGVITLSVTDKDPKRAAAMVQAYIEEMNRVAADLNTSAAHRERVFLEERLKTAGQDLDQASLDLSQFSSKNSVMDVPGQERAMMDAAARVQGELIASQSELKGLEQIYSDDNLRVRSLKARIGALQGQLNQLVGNYTDPAAADPGPGASGAYPSMRTLPALGYRYASLYRRAKIQEVVFEFLTQQYEAARITEAKELPVVRVMDAGDVPEKKSSPIRSLVVGLSVLGAFALACLWVVEKHRWDQLPQEDARRVLAAEVAAETKQFLQRIRRNRIRLRT